MVDWADVLKTVGSTTVVVAVLGFLAKSISDHLFRRDLDAHKATLKLQADRELADARARVDRELAVTKAAAEAALLAQKEDFDRQLEMFKTELATRTARADRIRQEIVRWANPIFGSVVELQRRLHNILDEEGYLALSSASQARISPGWSITYEYFLSSTVYLFCQYFSWIRLLEESLNFELFEKHAEKDAFFDRVHAVGRNLSDYPLAELSGISGVGDRQVFTLQQRALGETVTVLEEGKFRCMRYSDFLAKWRDPAFSGLLSSMTDFISELEPATAHRWKRLELMAKALQQLRVECEQLLTTKVT